MSILKNQRKTSPHQFVSNYYGISDSIKFIIGKIPKRKNKFIPYELYKCLVDFQHTLILLDEYIKPSNKEEYVANIRKAGRLFFTLPEYIFRILMLSEAEISRGFVNELEAKLNSEAVLLLKMMERNGIGVCPRRIRLYDRNKVIGVTYLERMLELYRMTMAKITHLQDDYFKLSGVILYETITNAFYCAYRANETFNDTEENINKRRKFLQKSLSYLEAYERELFRLFTYIDYQDDIIGAFSNKLDECNKLLGSIIKSDNKKLRKLSK